MWPPPPPLAYPPWTSPAATSSRTDSSYHGASPAQVRDKTEFSRRSLSFPPNFKPSHALNYWLSNLQESFCLPAMSASHENFSWNYPCGATTSHFWKKKEETIGDGLFFCFPIRI